jgi:hypothetical protein
MSADVLIHRCTLRLVRRGGWSWGASPERLLAAAVKELPRLVAERLAALWPAELEREIAAPARLDVRMSLRELAALAMQSLPASQQDSMSHEALRARVDAAVRELVACYAAPLDAAVETPSTQSAASPDATLAADPHEGAVLRALLEWHRAGRLAAMLVAFPIAALEAWHAALMRANARRVDDLVPPSAESLEDIAARIAIEPLPLLPGRRAALVRRMLFIAAAASSDPLGPRNERVRQILRTLPVFASATASPAEATQSRTNVDSRDPGAAAEDRVDTAVEEMPRDALRDARAQRLPWRNDSFEARVECALPFLLLGPLARCGYLATVAATLEAAQLEGDAAHFATALARKVLDPPARGWHRDAASVACAAAFAGCPSPLPDPEIAQFARALAPCAGALDAMVAGALAAGHEGGKALLLQRARCGAEDGLLLCHEDGLFAVAWQPRVELLFATLAAFAEAPVIVPRAVATPAILAALDAAAFCFLTDAPPGRGEAWHPVPGGSARAWTNREVGTERLRLLANRIDELAPESEALWRDLFVERPALPGAGEPGVERSLTLGAALGLGAISWELWRARERPTPMLATERFGDFGAVVRFMPDRVEVRLPQGRRFADLDEHGLLADVAGVPWLGGRPVRFGRG